MPEALSVPATESDAAALAALSTHLSDTSDAHDASAVSFSPTGTIAATDVQAAVAEVASEAGATSPLWQPSDNGLITWSYDPAEAPNANGGAAGWLLTVLLPIRTQVTVANMHIVVTTGGTPMAGQNFGAIWSTTGTLIAKTADQASSWNTAGMKTMALTAEAGQSLTLPAGYVIAGYLYNGTGASFARANTSTRTELINAGRSSPAMRAGAKGSGFTAIPSSLSGVSADSQPYWMALS